MDELNVMVMAVALGVSALVCLLVVATQRWHGRLSLDHDLHGAQKFHDTPVPRVGGLGLIAGLGAGALAYLTLAEPALHLSEDTSFPLLLLLCGLPAFAAGLLEDMTKRVRVSVRLLATFVSAGLAVWGLDAQLTRLDTWGLDDLMVYTPVAIVFTCFAVGGVANAVNIIDGFNGLASGSVVLMLAGLGGLAWLAGDSLVLQLCLIGVAALLGFMALNYPFGKIFLGDGGAYLAGFWLAECAVLLLARNPDVSTWAVLLACIYPVFETVFSMWRKDIYRKTGMGKPDKVHFHMLVFRRLVGQRLGRQSPAWIRHGVTSMYMWLLVAACQAWVFSLTLAGHGSIMMAIGVVTFAAFYVVVYRTLVLGCFPQDVAVNGQSPMHA